MNQNFGGCPQYAKSIVLIISDWIWNFSNQQEEEKRDLKSYCLMFV